MKWESVLKATIIASLTIATTSGVVAHAQELPTTRQIETHNGTMECEG